MFSTYKLTFSQRERTISPCRSSTRRLKKVFMDRANARTSFAGRAPLMFSRAMLGSATTIFLRLLTIEFRRSLGERRLNGETQVDRDANQVRKSFMILRWLLGDH